MVEFVTVQVEEHEELPDGCVLRFKAQGDGWPIERLQWESEDGAAGAWRVEAAFADGSRGPARAYRVDDSSAGTSILVVGGDRGLRLTLDGGPTVAEPYLLVRDLG